MNNNILIGHLGWDGCHFLGCCLAMSDKVYFNNFTLRGKVEYYFKNMTHIGKMYGKPLWTDVFMFHGSSYQSPTYIHYRNAWINDPKSDYEQFSSDSRTTESTLLSRMHVPIYYPLQDMIQKDHQHPLTEMFKSIYFICLVNIKLFCALRTIKLEHNNRELVEDSWDKGHAPIADIKWYDGPLDYFNQMTNSLTISQFQSLPKDAQENIKKYHKANLDDLFGLTELYKSDNDFLKTLITHQWDCDWFLSEDETFENLKILYSQMDLGEINEELIRKMYRIWLKKMDYIKSWYIKDSNQFVPSTEQHCPPGCWPSERWIEESNPAIRLRVVDDEQ